MPRAVVLILACLAPLQEEADIARWIDDIGHEELGLREEAQAALIKAGPRALTALKKALESKDADKVARLRAVVEEIERPERERTHDALERKRVLELYTVDFKNEKSTDVVVRLQELLGAKFNGAVDPDTRVTLSMKEQPLRKILDAIEDQAESSLRLGDSGWQAFRVKLARKPRAYVPGVTLDFTAKTFKVDDKAIGIRIKASMEGTAHAFIESWEATGKDGKPRTVKQCASCGPLLALVEGPPEELHIRLKGRIQWNSNYEINIANPGGQQSFRIGSYMISYEFPKVAVTSPEELEPHRFPYAYLEGIWKAGRRPDSGFGGRFGRRAEFGEKKRPPGVWCDCGPDPKPAMPARPPIKSREFSDYEGNAATDFESMKIHFRKPIQEPFETDAVIPAE